MLVAANAEVRQGGGVALAVSAKFISVGTNFRSGLDLDTNVKGFKQDWYVSPGRVLTQHSSSATLPAVLNPQSFLD